MSRTAAHNETLPPTVPKLGILLKLCPLRADGWILIVGSIMIYVCVWLCSLDESKMSEADQELVETDRADKSLFVQELLLALLSDHCETGEVVRDTAAEETLVKVASAVPQTKADTSAASHTAGVEPSRAATASSVNMERVPAAAAAVPRTNRIPAAAGSMPPMDGNRIVPNQSSSGQNLSSRSAIVKRKPLPAATRTGKDSTPPATTANKRH